MKLIRFLPSLIWMIVIFYFSSRSTVGIGTNVTDRFLILKSFHLIEYAALAVFLFIAFLKYQKTALIAYIYALTDEFHQSFIPGRTSKFTDTLIDLLGILIGLIFIKYIIKYFVRN